MAENTTPTKPTIEELMAQLEAQRVANVQKDAALAKKDAELSQKDAALNEKDAELNEKDVELTRMAEELDATASAKDLALPVFVHAKKKYRLNAPKFQLVGEDGPRTAEDVRKDKELQKKLVELGGDLLTELTD